MTHILRISHSGSHNGSATPDSVGNYPVRMVRKQLVDSDITPSNIRYNTTTHKIQITLDGGSTWTDYTDDPRSNPLYRLPVRAGSNKQCDAAANMTGHVSDYITQALLTASVVEAIAATVLDFGLIIFPVTGVVGLLVDLVAVTVSNLIALGTTAIAAAMTTGVFDQLTEIMYCQIGSDGQVSSAQLAAIEAKVSASIASTAALIINSVLEMWGAVGLSNVGTQGGLTGSCGGYGCEWCYKFDFQTASHSDFWTCDSGYGTYISSGGYGGLGSYRRTNLAGLILRCNFPSHEITEVEWKISFSGTIDEQYTAYNLGGSRQYTSTVSPSSSPQQMDVVHTVTCDQIILNPAGATNPDMYIYECTVKGHGTNPFGSDNC